MMQLLPLEILFLLGYKNIYKGERWMDFWWEGIFLGQRMMSKFLAGGDKT